MRAMVVLCHPFESSLCHAIAAGVGEALAGGGADVVRHDLYAERFDPLLSGAEIARHYPLDEQTQHHCDELERSGLLAVVHPDWWSGPPALLKGWVDRVFRPGVAYAWEGEAPEEKRHRGLFAGKRALVFVTTDREDAERPAAIGQFWSDVCSYCGMELRAFTLFCDVRRSGYRTRRRWLTEAAASAVSCLKEGP